MASAVHNRSEIFDTIVKKLRRNPFFMNAFLRSFADYGFEPVEQNVAVRNSERKNRQMGTALGKGNGSFDARPLETELHFVVQRDLFCALESTVKTYEMSSICFHAGHRTHSQKDVEALYDARRAVTLLTVDKVRRLAASVAAKKRLLVNLCSFGRRMLRLLRTFVGHITVIDIASFPALSSHAVLLDDLLHLYFHAVTALSLPKLSVPESSLHKFGQIVVNDLLEKRNTLFRLVAEKLEEQNQKAGKRVPSIHMDQNNGLVWETYCRFHDHLRNLEYRLERLESTKDERTSQKKFSGPTDVSKNLTSGEHDLPYKVCPLVGKPGSSTSVNPFEDSVCTQSHSTYEQHTSNESGAQSPEHLDRLMEEFLTEGKEQEQSFNVESDNSI